VSLFPSKLPGEKQSTSIASSHPSSSGAANVAVTFLESFPPNPRRNPPEMEGGLVKPVFNGFGPWSRWWMMMMIFVRNLLLY
jgi:hypothetical protein